MNLIKAQFGLWVLCALCSGCATIANGTKQTVTIDSIPSAAKIQIQDRSGDIVHNGITPTTVDLQRGAGPYVPEKFQVKLWKEGYEPSNTELGGTVSA